jgi:Glycosyl hydrolases family 28
MTATRKAVVSLAALALTLGASPWAVPAAAASNLNVRAFGATGDGVTIDTPAIDAAIAAASDGGGATVEFPAGTYLSVTIHLRSHVTLQLDAGATILAAPGTGYDLAEPNAFDQFQDYGHSHFHDALMWGENLVDIGFVGPGAIDGGGHLITGTPAAGRADKAISIKVCDGLTLSGITIRRGGHFAILSNGCNHVTADHLNIDTAHERDGWNIINTQNVRVTNTTIASNDDALAFKSDFALGYTLPNGNVTVTDTTLAASCCNGLMFGSETCGDFSNYDFSRISILSAGKSGIGIVSMDGAHISGLSYSDITMTQTASPIYMRIGTRGRCPGSPPAGSISGISLTNITGTNAHSPVQPIDYTPTIAGLAGDPIQNVLIANVNLTLPGGHPASDAALVPPANPGDYNPKSFGIRPAYGWWLRDVSGISLVGSSVRFEQDDGRPAIQVSDGTNVLVAAVTAQTGTTSPYDVGFAASTGFQATGCVNPDGAPLRVNVTQ